MDLVDNNSYNMAPGEVAWQLRALNASAEVLGVVLRTDTRHLSTACRSGSDALWTPQASTYTRCTLTQEQTHERRTHEIGMGEWWLGRNRIGKNEGGVH